MIKDSWIKPQQDDELIIEYFNSEQLKEFLFKEEDKENPRPPRGILQKFIDPFGDHQTIIQSVWSPQLCVFSKRLNHKYLYDPRWDAYERLVTFDGAEVYSRTVPLRGKQISQSIRSACKIIADKVQHVSFENYKIARMVLYFKPDKDNVLHFLYCSGIRLVNERLDENLINIKKMHHTPLIVEGSQFKKPDNVKLIQTTNTMRPVKLLNDIQCLNCKQKIQKSDLVSVDYKFIIETLEDQLINQYKTNIEVLEIMEEKYYEKSELKKEFVKSSAYEMPDLIRLIYPKMTVEMYQQLSKHKHFLSKQIQLCQLCYEMFVGKDPMSGVERKGEEDLKFIKKGMAKKKPLFTREIKCIVAEKNKELAQENFSKNQKPQIFQTMIDQHQAEITRKQLEQNDKTYRKQQVDKFYQKLNYQPNIQDKIKKIKRITDRQFTEFHNRNELPVNRTQNDEFPQNKSSQQLIYQDSSYKPSKTQLDISQENQYNNSLQQLQQQPQYSQEELEEQKLEQNHIYHGQRRKSSQVQLYLQQLQQQSSIYSNNNNNQQDSIQQQQLQNQQQPSQINTIYDSSNTNYNTFQSHPNKPPRIMSGYSQSTSTKAFSKHNDLSQSHKFYPYQHNNNTFFTDTNDKRRSFHSINNNNKKRTQLSSTGQIIKRPQTSLLINSPNNFRPNSNINSQYNTQQHTNIGNFFKDSINKNQSGNKGKKKKQKRVQTAMTRPQTSQQSQSNFFNNSSNVQKQKPDSKQYDNFDFNDNTVDSQVINQNNSKLNNNNNRNLEQINNDYSDDNFEIIQQPPDNQNQKQLEYYQRQIDSIKQGNINNDGELTDEQKLIDQQLSQQQQDYMNIQQPEQYLQQQQQQQQQTEEIQKQIKFQPKLLQFSDQDFKDMDNYLKQDEKKKKKYIRYYQ